MARRTLVAGVVAVAVVTLGGCGADSAPSATPRPAPSESVAPVLSATPAATATGSPSPRLTSVDALAPGDCFAAVSEPVVEVAVVDCEDPHVHEVFAVVQHEAAADVDHPGDEALLRYADDVCLRPFEEYVAVDYLASAYWITSIVPSPAGWADGDRRIVCTLRLGEDGAETSGSAQGTGE